MERLTARTPEGIAYLAKVRPNEQEVEASKHTCECLYESWQKLADIEDAEENGTLHIAPCKDGTDIWRIVADEALEEFLALNGPIYRDTYLHGYTEFMCGELGKGWFLSEPEAQKALGGEVE